MKKLFILLIFSIIIVSGCGNREIQIQKNKDLPNKEKVDEYIDLNDTPISFYKLEGNTLIKLEKINTNLVGLEDIGLFKVFPSTDSEINLNNFADDFNNLWLKYNSNNNLKIGFQIDYSLDSGEDISYLILNPTNAMEKWQYIMGYLYDDILNKGKSFYSHIEEDEFTDNNIFTSIKLQSGGEVERINSKLLLTVFTYDGEDDFFDNNYRGNSFSTLTICVEGKNCD